MLEFEINQYWDEDWYKRLDKRVKDFLDKLEADPELDNADKQSFLNSLKAEINNSNSKIVEFSENYFRDYGKFLGSDYSGDKNIPFVRMKAKKELLALIQEATVLDSKLAERTLEPILDKNLPVKVRAARYNEFLDLNLRSEDPGELYNITSTTVEDEVTISNITFGKYIGWSFPDPRDNTNKELEDVEITDWDCRAGLSESRNIEKVILLQDLSDEKPLCKPTVFDAEFYPQFEPGGTTKPLSECKDKDGFNEYIHNEVPFSKHLYPPFRLDS